MLLQDMEDIVAVAIVLDSVVDNIFEITHCLVTYLLNIGPGTVHNLDAAPDFGLVYIAIVLATLLVIFLR
jgi:hypothetical protein